MNQGTIRVATNAVELDSVLITDATAVALISGAKAEERLGLAINCLQLGARVMSFANDQLAATNVCDQIAASAESVDKQLKSITKTTQERIDETVAAVFGGNGKPGTFDQNLGRQLKLIELQLITQLDPQKANSITGQLREALIRDGKQWMDQLRSQTNLADPKSAFGLLKVELDGKLKGLEEKLNLLVTQQAVRSAVTTEKVRGTQKGTDFEDVL